MQFDSLEKTHLSSFPFILFLQKWEGPSDMVATAVVEIDMNKANDAQAKYERAQEVNKVI